MRPWMIDALLFGATCAYAGYSLGKIRGWDEPYKLGHTHGYTLGMLDACLKKIDVAIKKAEEAQRG